MTVKPDKTGSHGKARILSYGHDYEKNISLSKEERKAGFKKQNHHFDDTLGLVAEPYPLSEAEQQEADDAAEKTPDALLQRIVEIENTLEDGDQ